jgi:hypothetical protein
MYPSEVEIFMILEDIITKQITDENHPKIQEYLKWATQTYNDDVQKFELWVEYLKRSDKFKKVCEWFQKTKRKNPYPSDLKECKHKVSYIEDYLIFATHYNKLRSESPLITLKTRLSYIHLMRDNSELFRDISEGTFFVWAVDAGYPEYYQTETLLNLFVFGNIFKDPKEITLLRVLNLIESRNKSYAFKLGDIIDTIFKHIETHPLFLDGREASTEEYKHRLKLFFDSDFFLNISLIDPFENKDKTTDAIKDLIEKRRANLSSIDKKQFGLFKPDQFEWPTGSIRVDELKRYLQSYDLKLKGYKNREIASKTFKGLDPNDEDTKSRVKRDNRYAKRILKNVDYGFFPGKYH